jgi:hypothetical protein
MGYRKLPCITPKPLIYRDYFVYVGMGPIFSGENAGRRTGYVAVRRTARPHLKLR